MQQPRGEGLALFRHERCRPILVVDAEPARRRGVERDQPGLGDRAVALLPESLIADGADHADVKDVIALTGGFADARHASVRRQRHRHAAGIGHPVGDAEHVPRVHRDRAREREPRAVVVAERHRRRRRQFRAGGRRPYRVRTGRGSAPLGSDPTELGEIGIRGAARREQHDRRALVVDRLVVVVQPKVVDAAAGEIDRAGDAIRGDRHARRARQRLVPRQRRLAIDAARRRPGGGRRAACGRRVRRLLRRLLIGELLLGGLFLARALELGAGEEQLPCEQHRERHDDGDEEVAIIWHPKPSRSATAPPARPLDR